MQSHVVYAWLVIHGSKKITARQMKLNQVLPNL